VNRRGGGCKPPEDDKNATTLNMCTIAALGNSVDAWDAFCNWLVGKYDPTVARTCGKQLFSSFQNKWNWCYGNFGK
jgi:hypothetical protein